VSSLRGLRHDAATLSSYTTTSGDAQGGIYGIVSPYGGLRPGTASLSSYSSTSGVAQGGIHGLLSSHGGLRPVASTLSSYTPSSGPAQFGIHGLNILEHTKGELLHDSYAWKLWLPLELISEVLRKGHGDPLASHGGVHKRLERIRR